jgi:hypothetical protein
MAPLSFFASSLAAPSAQQTRIRKNGSQKKPRSVLTEVVVNVSQVEKIELLWCA